MRVVGIGLVAGLVLVCGFWLCDISSQDRVAHGQIPATAQSGYINRGPQAQPIPGATPTQSVSGGELLAIASDASEGYQLLTLIDPKTRIISVYQIDRATGKIALRSVRNVHWDLQMEEYNSVNPSPREIRNLLQQR